MCCQYVESISPIACEAKGYGWLIGTLLTWKLLAMRKERYPAKCHDLQPCEHLQNFILFSCHMVRVRSNKNHKISERISQETFYRKINIIADQCEMSLQNRIE